MAREKYALPIKPSTFCLYTTNNDKPAAIAEEVFRYKNQEFILLQNARV
jgi:hypothetical protein